MRLISLEVRGFKRFEEAKIKLDADVIALVGPNEAGKTALLEALAHLNAEGEFRSREITRELSLPAGHIVLGARFLLEPEDQAALEEFVPDHDARWFVVTKNAGGDLDWRIEPALPVPSWGPGVAARVRGQIDQILKSAWAKKNATTLELKRHLGSLRDYLSTDEGPIENLAALREIGEVFDDESLRKKSPPKSFGDLLRWLRSFPEEYERAVAAREAAHKKLWNRCPDFLMFGEAERTLEETYDLARALPDPPEGLNNLALLAGLDLKRLFAAQQSKDVPKTKSMVANSNDRLQEVFSGAWTQSHITVQLDSDGTLLHLLVKNPVEGYTSIAERSQGLRSFVALIAFVAARNLPRRPILLIDEAEAHLHYDAQADLVRVLTKQEAAVQVFYTTHSAGCLPEDLGTGVRLVLPTGESRSVVRNSFWIGGPGFSPLLFGMGASTLAFTPTRHAVIGEGASEMILLPSLLREATGLRSLGYQVAPGLAIVEEESVQSLDLEAGRVAYLVDGDEAGAEIRSKLRRSGIEEGRIVAVGGARYPGYVLEDMVDEGAFRGAVAEELRRSHGDLDFSDLKLPTKNRPGAVRLWCEKQGIPMPSKVAVATRIVEGRRTVRLVEPRRKNMLIRLHGELEKALVIQRPPP